MTTAQHKIGSGFGATSTASEVLAGIDLTGELAIVTGGYSGIGLETTRALTRAGAHVVVPARRRATAEEALRGFDESRSTSWISVTSAASARSPNDSSLRGGGSTSSSAAPGSWRRRRRASGRAGRRSSRPTTSGTSPW
jgi:NAD(P)-dependent dehydrogenase (short-subunit alcohol dehydrogenase family)